MSLLCINSIFDIVFTVVYFANQIRYMRYFCPRKKQVCAQIEKNCMRKLLERDECASRVEMKNKMYCRLSINAH